jgi:hypothetical protein
MFDRSVAIALEISAAPAVLFVSIVMTPALQGDPQSKHENVADLR